MSASHKLPHPTNILDLAAFIVAERPLLSTMALQKLCFFADSWNSVWTGEPIVTDIFEAWASGPVSRRLYNEHAGQYSVDHVNGGNPDALTDDHKIAVRAVLTRYAHISGPSLSEISKLVGSWTAARGTIEAGRPCTMPVSKQETEAWFQALVSSGSARRA